MPVTLRLDLLDRQAGYYYLNGARKKWLVPVMLRSLDAFNEALIYLSYPAICREAPRIFEIGPTGRICTHNLTVINRALYS